MGKFWLHDINDILRKGIGKGIVDVIEIPGWELRSRPTGGFDSINGMLKHHTASPESWDWDRDLDYLVHTNPFAPSPIANIYHGRSGKIAIIAAGASNHGGKGGAYKPGGPTYVAVDKANTTLIGNEMGNAGTGEQWTWQQIEASITVDALICLAEKWGPGNVFAHKEYCGPGTTTPGRKIDPFGPWENHPNNFWAPGSSWGGGQSNIDYYRSLVAKKMAALSQEVNLMFAFSPKPDLVPSRIFDTRGPVGPNRDAFKLPAGQSATVNVPGGAGKGYAIVNLTATEGDGDGYFTCWAEGPMPISSALNWYRGQNIANEITVPLAADGSFKVYSPSRVHVIVDLVGYYQKI